MSAAPSGEVTATQLASPDPIDAIHGARRTTCRMFETPLIERFSRVHWSTPFLFWLPIFGYVSYYSFTLGVTALPFAGLVLLGMFVWSLSEYVLHRWLFHYVGPRPWQRRMYFIIHGVHHDYPSDADRLVMPLGASIPMASFFYLVFRLVAGPIHAHPFFVGFGLGYLAYDGIHFAVHHFRMPTRAGKWLKRYHMIHHHTGVAARYGVSSPLWDYVFRTAGGEKAPSR